MTVVGLQREIQQLTDEMHSDIEAFDERAAIRSEAVDDGKTTTQHAIDALQRPERFPGEHDVARGWLRSKEPHTTVIVRVKG